MSNLRVLYFAKTCVMSTDEVDEFLTMRKNYPQIRALNASVSGKYPDCDLAFGSIPENYKVKLQTGGKSENAVGDKNEAEPVPVAVKPTRKGFKRA